MLAACSLFFTVPSPARANDGPIEYGQGGAIRLIDSEDIRLIRERVTIDTHYDSESYGSFVSDVKVTYKLKNLKKSSVKVKTGFPVGFCHFTDPATVARDMGFLVCDGKKMIDATSVVQEKDDATLCWILWELEFAPAEKKTLTISYTQPWSLYWNEEAGSEEERFSYMLTPAASWAGTIGSAVVTLTLASTRPAHDKENSSLAVKTGDLAFSIKPAAVKKKKGSKVFVWKFKSWEPESELTVSYCRRS
jgi:hypothetical protein